MSAPTGPKGATVSVDRRFNNGFSIGAYFTQTDVSYADFGEGSFDKGIRIEIPYSWFTGQPSLDVMRQTIQPVLRDGGARLNVDNRLYSVIKSSRGKELRDGWGKFLR